MKVLCFIISITVVYRCEALSLNLCQEMPVDKDCLIDRRVRDTGDQPYRFAFNWDTKSCTQIRWSQDCFVNPEGLNNNFGTEEECQLGCGNP